MSRTAMHSVREQLTRLFSVGTVAGLDEAQLLARFLRDQDQTAFEAIVARHGPMVWSVCRRLAGEPHNAEDAFQATFLVLVRRAASLRDPGRLGPWLCGVAHRVAARVRRQAAQRRQRESARSELAAVQPVMGPDLAHEVPAAELHEELARLPRFSREVILLCDLEDYTHAEAARLLGWPLGTVKGRLHRARVQLRKRLERRGVTLSAAALSLALAHEGRAQLPALMTTQTVRAAVASAGGGSVVAAGLGSGAAWGLAQGVNQTMLIASVTKSISAVAGLGLLSAGVWAYQGAKPQDRPAGAAAGIVADASPLQDLPDEAQERQRRFEAQREHYVQVTRDLYELMRGTYQSMPDRVSRMVAASQAMMRAELSVAPDEPAKRQAREGHVQRMSEIAKSERVLFDEYRKREREQGPFGGPPEAELFLREAETALAAALVEARQGAALPPQGDMGTGAATTAPSQTGAQASSDAADLFGTEMSATQPAGASRIPQAASDPFAAPGPAVSAPFPEQASDALIPPIGDSALFPPVGSQPARARQFAPSGDPFAALAAGGPAAQPIDARTQAILRVLDQPIDMTFEHETPLQEVLRFLKNCTDSPELPGGLPIYVDPRGLEDAEKTLQSPVIMGLQGVPLKTTLRLLLRSLDLNYVVQEGFIRVSSETMLFEQFLSGSPEPILGDPPVPGYGAIPRDWTPTPYRPRPSGGMGEMHGGGAGGGFR